MFTFILTVCLTVAWLILYYLTVRYELKRYTSLCKRCSELDERLRKLKNIKNENAELKAEIRNLKTQLKELMVSRSKEGEK